MKKFTLCIIYKSDKVLLGLKKRGFGEGIWNGFGGKVEEGESEENAVKREIKEETGLSVNDIEKMGIIRFDFQDGSSGLEAHIFRSKFFSGEPMETEEMKPEWFDKDNLPIEEMWPADTYWLPFLLNGKKFKGRFLYDRPSTSSYKSEITEKILSEVNQI
ncbi:MAG: 8-oxo-dGTP diphosphatase [Patescibacteria group bacterium]